MSSLLTYYFMHGNVSAMTYRYNFDLSVYFIADPSACGGRDICDIVSYAIKGGVSMVQLRNKSGDLAEIESQAIDIKEILAESAIPFIINDHVELAAKIGADGVHIGQGDMSASKARDIIGESAILGVTAFTREHFAAIDVDIIDYVGTGPCYPTLTKPDKHVLSVQGFAELAKDSPVPVVGIGGITPQNAGAVINAGASGVAMMRSISMADSPKSAARAFYDI